MLMLFATWQDNVSSAHGQWEWVVMIFFILLNSLLSQSGGMIRGAGGIILLCNLHGSPIQVKTDHLLCELIIKTILLLMAAA